MEKVTIRPPKIKSFPKERVLDVCGCTVIGGFWVYQSIRIA